MIMKIFKILFPIYLIIFPLFPAEINKRTLFTEFFLLGILLIYVIGKYIKDREEFLDEIKSFLKSNLVRVLIIIVIFMGISVLYSPDKLLAFILDSSPIVKRCSDPDCTTCSKNKEIEESVNDILRSDSRFTEIVEEHEHNQEMEQIRSK